MRGRRTYAKLDPARTRLKKEILDGKTWQHGATSDYLMRYLVRTAKIPNWEKRYFEWDPDTGDLDNQGLYYHTQSFLKNLRIQATLAGGKKINIRAIVNIKTGKPLDSKRAEDPDSTSRDGIWIPWMALTRSAVDQQIQMYMTRSTDAKAIQNVLNAADIVLEQHGPNTVVGDVWNEILDLLMSSEDIEPLEDSEDEDPEELDSEE